VPGVARVSPDLQGTALIAGKDSTAVGGNGAPGLGFAFEPDSPAFTLVQGTVSSFSITADRGVTQNALRAAVAAVLPSTAEARRLRPGS
jgi:hypothetical protein